MCSHIWYWHCILFYVSYHLVLNVPLLQSWFLLNINSFIEYKSGMDPADAVPDLNDY
jgi:hypothetical protein